MCGTNLMRPFIGIKWPELWNARQIEDFTTKYPWLTAKDGKLGCTTCHNFPVSAISRAKGSNASKEWVNIGVCPENISDDRQEQLRKWRKKIAKHLTTAYHQSAEALTSKDQTKADVDSLLYEGMKKHEAATEKVFRTAYMVAKENMPYISFPKLIDLQTLNKCDTGIILHSETTCKDIINFVAVSMRQKICSQIITQSSKLSVLIDESTTVSGKSCLIIHISYLLDDMPTIMFLDIVELAKADADTITSTLTDALSKHGFDLDYLKQNMICFACDGASVMLGSNSGVGTQLKKLVPDLLVWHCCNHRLELAVDDAVKDVSGLNPFTVFMDSMYALYHPSPKNQAELKAVAAELQSQVSKIGRVLDTRWAASSLRSLEAVWKSYTALATHFKHSSESSGRSSTERSKFKGLYKYLTSVNFVTNLSVMLDALSEISKLSIQLQKRDVSLMTAHKLILHTVKTLESMKTNTASCEYYKQVCEIINSECEEEEDGMVYSFKDVDISRSNKVALINRRQFLQSLANSLKSRMLTTSANRNEKPGAAKKLSDNYAELLKQTELLDYKTWPLDYEEDVSFGQSELSQLARKMRVDVEKTLAGFVLMKATGGQLNEELKPLSDSLRVIPISTAECERGFSCMNNVLTSSRNMLNVTNLSQLMFISIVGPDLCNFDPIPYTKLWLASGRHSAYDTKSMKRRTNADGDSYYKHCHKYLK